MSTEPEPELEPDELADSADDEPADATDEPWQGDVLPDEGDAGEAGADPDRLAEP